MIVLEEASKMSSENCYGVGITHVVWKPIETAERSRDHILVGRPGVSALVYWGKYPNLVADGRYGRAVIAWGWISATQQRHPHLHHNYDMNIPIDFEPTVWTEKPVPK